MLFLLFCLFSVASFLFCFQEPTWKPCWSIRCTTLQTWMPSSPMSSPLISMRCLSTSEPDSTSEPALLFGIHQCTIPVDVKRVCVCEKKKTGLVSTFVSDKSFVMSSFYPALMGVGGSFHIVTIIIDLPLWNRAQLFQTRLGVLACIWRDTQWQIWYSCVLIISCLKQTRSILHLSTVVSE